MRSLLDPTLTRCVTLVKSHDLSVTQCLLPRMGIRASTPWAVVKGKCEIARGLGINL